MCTGSNTEACPLAIATGRPCSSAGPSDRKPTTIVSPQSSASDNLNQLFDRKQRRFEKSRIPNEPPLELHLNQQPPPPLVGSHPRLRRVQQIENCRVAVAVDGTKLAGNQRRVHFSDLPEDSSSPGLQSSVSSSPHRSIPVSKQTGAAIVYALEQPFRRPFGFTPVSDEERDSMSELGEDASRPGLKPASRGNADGDARRAMPRSSSGFKESFDETRMPQEMVNQRLKREARRNIEEEIRRGQQTAATLAASQAHDGSPLLPDSATRPENRSTNPGQGRSSNPGQGSEPNSEPRSDRSTDATDFSLPFFPHAFDRWEQLSAHWEGMSAFWVRRIRQNEDELRRDPLSRQLARQVNDLSAAGANLFHAVVELQRLRASSERKFQRWFFETRAQQERVRERLVDRENRLAKERRSLEEATKLTEKLEAEKDEVEQKLVELARELKISKEESRRAWEELGRREQEERDRTLSLRNGEPTLVGGVQVVPMLQGMSDRHSSISRPPTREGPYEGGPDSTAMGGQASPLAPSATPSMTESFTSLAEQASAAARPMSPEPTPSHSNSELMSSPNPIMSPQLDGPSHPTMTFPLATGPASNRSSPAPTVSTPGTYNSADQPPFPSPSSSLFYHHQGISLHSQETRDDENDAFSDQSPHDTVSDVEFELDEHGRVRLDAQGHPISYPHAPASDGNGEEFVEDSTDSSGTGPSDAFVRNELANPDYTGADYGSGAAWGTIRSQHNATRLSDVLEEDEHSRTSPSHASSAR